MTGNNRFNHILDRVDMMIEEGILDESKDLLEQVYNVKPVGIRWFVSNARYMKKSGKPVREVIGYLKDKCSLDYEYDGVDDYVSYMLELYMSDGNMCEYNRLKYEYDRMLGKEQGSEPDFSIDLSNLGIVELRKLCDALYEVHEDFIASVIGTLLKCRYNDTALYSNLKMPNLFPFLKYRGKVIFVRTYETECESSNNMFQILKWALKELGIITEVIFMSRDDDNCLIFSDLEKYIFNQDEFNIVISSGYIIDEICVGDSNKKYCERLTRSEKDYFEDKLAAGRIGGYIDYIGCMYGLNAWECFSNAQIKYSFVIPARNIAETLGYTVRTCLDCKRNDFEIVISDNSDDSSDSVRKACDELLEELARTGIMTEKNAVIRYVKTPYNFPLARSFEYAILKSKGEFVIPLGADDGVFPWMLDILDEVLSQYPDDDIFQWGFAGYQWPGVKQNKACRNIFNVPHIYRGERVVCEYVDCSAVRNEAVESPGKMYRMPTLYMTSGFRRRYLGKLYEKTGRLWGGINQDISTGLLNTCVYDRFVYIKEVLSIIGQSSSSIGCQNLKISQKAQAESALWDNKDMIGQSFQGYIDRMIPDTGGEIIYMYIALLYGISLGVLEESVIKSVNWSNAFSYIIRQMDISDDQFFKKLNALRLGGYKLSDSDCVWFDKLCEEYINYVIIEKNGDEPGQAYDEVMEKDRFTINAMAHGISNIHEAVDYCRRWEIHV